MRVFGLLQYGIFNKVWRSGVIVGNNRAVWEICAQVEDVHAQEVIDSYSAYTL